MKHLRNVLAALVMVGLITSVVQAKTYSQKTFLSPRPVGFNAPMEYTTWHEHVYGKRENPKLHSHLMVTGFYQGSQNDSGLAKYFGAGDGEKGFTVGPDTPAADISNDLLIFRSNLAAARPLAGTATFKPEEERWGARLDFFQDVFKPFKKLYFKASLPIVYVDRTLKMNVASSVPVLLENGQKATVQDFFAGNVNNSQKTTQVVGGVNDSQLLPLTKSKINGRRTTTSVEDLDLVLGYKWHEDAKSHCYGYASVLIPLANKPKGDYLFEPRAGNGGHWALGLGVDGGAHLWENKRSSLKILASLNYKYLFETSEKRLLSINAPELSNLNLGIYAQYYPIVYSNHQKGDPLQPAANVLTRDVSVRPGSMFDGMVAFSFKSSNFTIDLGYDLYFKDDESVKLQSFEDGAWSLAATTFKTSGGAPDADNLLLERYVNKSDINVDAAKTPWELTQSIFAGLGYTSKIYKEYPFSVGVGGAYEFVADNASEEFASAWLKLGISF